MPRQWPIRFLTERWSRKACIKVLGPLCMSYMRRDSCYGESHFSWTLQPYHASFQLQVLQETRMSLHIACANNLSSECTCHHSPTVLSEDNMQHRCISSPGKVVWCNVCDTTRHIDHKQSLFSDQGASDKCSKAYSEHLMPATKK